MMTGSGVSGGHRVVRWGSAQHVRFWCSSIIEGPWGGMLVLFMVAGSGESRLPPSRTSELGVLARCLFRDIEWAREREEGSRRKSSQHSKRGVGRFQADVGTGALDSSRRGLVGSRSSGSGRRQPPWISSLSVLPQPHTHCATENHQPRVASRGLYPNPDKADINFRLETSTGQISNSNSRLSPLSQVPQPFDFAT